MNGGARCYSCGTDKSLEVCVGCGRGACKLHRGDEGGSYWNTVGKKGYACGACIKSLEVYEGGALGSVNQHLNAVTRSVIAIEEYLAGPLARDIGKGVESAIKASLGGKTVDVFVQEAVKTTLGKQNVVTLVNETLRTAEDHATRLVDKLSGAISAQRATISLDAQQLARTIKAELEPVALEIRRETARTRRTALFIGIAIAAANFLGIWIGSVVAHR